MCWADANSSPSLIILTPQGTAGSQYVFQQWSDSDLRQIRPIGPVTGPATSRCGPRSTCSPWHWTRPPAWAL
jgi:hypothetical protein